MSKKCSVVSCPYLLFILRSTCLKFSLETIISELSFFISEEYVLNRFSSRFLMALRSPRPALRPKAMPIKAMARPVTLISGHFMTSNQREERVLNQMS